MATQVFSLESYYWTKNEVECPYELLNWLTELADVEYFQEQIRSYCCYTLSHNMYDKVSASVVIYDSTVLQSLFKAVYRIYLNPDEFNDKELTVSKVFEEELKGIKYLNEQEFKNPYLVFKTVFDRFTIEQVHKSFFNLTLATMANSECHKDYYCNVSILNFHKILDACKLIQLRDKVYYL
ncbi:MULTISPECIES: hypothetical protein [Myroides]|uniref:hypothetical protein n=1 Tax=Myroides TaxID=76831 RepID=UPI0015FCD668|nr:MULTISPECIES: hypothetical protein [Myroides]MBB1139029.1 hypothetical protein [Myroides sp. WP-1]MDM1035947.1 hypothetical protein [Myroides odoratimimus]MDM1060134.1 hypothetical protein [Myroides odoratimimus]